MEPSQANNERSQNGRRILVVMAKAPRPGMVKTRLAQSFPLAAVTELYRCLLDDTMTLAYSLGDVQVAIMCPAGDVEDLARLVPQATVVAQNGIGLAAGLTSVFAQFAADGQHSVVAFNSDSPHLPASIIVSAFEALDKNDVVVGPTHDGGYYLVGAKAVHPTLFENDGMGTSSALDSLLRRARSLQLSIAFTELFYDIDIHDDLTRLAAELTLAPERAPKTADWLKQWTQLAALRTGTAGL
jgi:uncharacterized protein